MPAPIERSAVRRDVVISRALPMSSPDLVSTPSASLAAAHALLRCAVWHLRVKAVHTQADAKGTRMAKVPASAWYEGPRMVIACRSTGLGLGSLAHNDVGRTCSAGRARSPHSPGISGSAHLVAEGADLVGIALTEDGQVGLGQALPRITDRRGTDVPGHHHRYLPHVFGAAGRDRRLDPSLFHRRNLIRQMRQGRHRLVVQIL